MAGFIETGVYDQTSHIQCPHHGAPDSCFPVTQQNKNNKTWDEQGFAVMQNDKQ